MLHLRHILLIMATYLIALNSFCSMQLTDPFTPSSITTIVPTLEAPPNFATSESTSFASEDGGEDDDTQLCFKCYSKLMEAQGLMNHHDSLVEKEKKLIRQRANAAAAARKPKPTIPNQKNLKSSQQNSTSAPRHPRNNFNNDQQNNDGRPIVVSRLRVARSASADSIVGLDVISNMDNLRNGSKSIIDPALKKLKHKQEQNFNQTCSVLYEVQSCLQKYNRECLGDLQFHSIEVVYKQWMARRNCPPKNDPSFRMFRTFPTEEEAPKVPIPRPITERDEVKHRLDTMFGRHVKPQGVILKPTLNRSPSQDLSQQQNRYEYSVGAASGYSIKGRHLLQGINDIPDYDANKIPLVNQLVLLVPCFALALIALIMMSIRYFKPRDAKI